MAQVISFSFPLLRYVETRCCLMAHVVIVKAVKVYLRVSKGRVFELKNLVLKDMFV
jgi:hypothetical protein